MCVLNRALSEKVEKKNPKTVYNSRKFIKLLFFNIKL